MNKSKESSPAERPANPLWRGRYSRRPAEAMAAINTSIDVDRQLYAQDIRASRVHCRMLAQCQIISSQDSTQILEGLDNNSPDRAGHSGNDQIAADFRLCIRDTINGIEQCLAVIIGMVQDLGVNKKAMARAKGDLA